LILGFVDYRTWPLSLSLSGASIIGPACSSDCSSGSEGGGIDVGSSKGGRIDVGSGEGGGIDIGSSEEGGIDTGSSEGGSLISSSCPDKESVPSDGMSVML